jgi:DNA-binding NtrC family response regulator
MPRELSVLILDDEPIVCDRVRPALEKSGFQVESFTESTAALERLSERSFDILVTDLKMKGPGGMDVLAFVRDRHPKTRSIVITGFATVETAKEAMQLGAVDFIPKPFRMKQLVTLIKKVAAELGLGEAGAEADQPE